MQSVSRRHRGLLKAKRLAAELARTHPDAAASLREGLEEMLTVRSLGIDATLARTLECTNMIESMFDIVRTTTRNVKRWRNDGDMRRRWAAAGLAEAERQLRRVRGYKRLPALVAALARPPAPLSNPPAILTSPHNQRDHHPRRPQQPTGLLHQHRIIHRIRLTGH